MKFKFVYLKEFIELIKNNMEKKTNKTWEQKAKELKGIYNKKNGNIFINLESNKFKELDKRNVVIEIIKTINHEYSHKSLEINNILKNEEILIALLNKQLPDEAFPFLIIKV